MMVFICLKLVNKQKAKQKTKQRRRNDVEPLSTAPGTSRQRMARLERLALSAISADRTIVRRLVNTAVYSSSVSGQLFQAPDISGVTTFPDWTVESQNYQCYRGMAMRIKFFPIINAVTSAAGANTGLPLINTASNWGGSAPASANESFQAPDAKVHDGHYPFSHEVDWSVNPNAQLWTRVGSAIANDNKIGISFASPTTYTLPVSTPLLIGVFEIFVEFGYFL